MRKLAVDRMRTETKRPVLNYVQYLRFFAAAMVVLHHATAKLGTPFAFGLGAAGVDIFFVISGFIIVFITQNREQSPKEFLLRRVTRVAPPYWLVTIALAVGMLLVPRAFEISAFSLDHVVASLLFWPYPHPTTHAISPVYAPGWTLTYEFFFYGLFAIALAASVELRALLTSLAILAFVSIGLAWPHGGTAYTAFTAPLSIEFIYGMLIAVIAIHGAAVGARVSAALIVLGVAGFVAALIVWPNQPPTDDRAFTWGIPSVLIVAGAVFLELNADRKVAKPLLVLGNASYAIYITHFLVVGPMLRSWKATGLTAGWVFVFAYFAAAIAIGVVFHFLIEKPLVVFFTSRLVSPALAVPETSPRSDRSVQ